MARRQACQRPNPALERVELSGDALVESVQMMALVLGQASVGGHGPQQTASERGVHALEELQKDDTDRVTLREQPIAAGVVQFFDQAFGPELREIVAQRGEPVLVGGRVEGGGGGLVQLTGGEGVTAGEGREADEGMS